jgi:DNA-binding MarR family transcriptional regulator
MRTKQIVIELLDYLEMYSKENPEADKVLTTTDFVGFLNSKFKPESVSRNRLSGGREEFLSDEFRKNQVATDVSILVSLLFRYAKMYIKKALKDSRINSADEFSFLITLLTHESLSKKEMIQLQVMEKTSGIEILNRLIAQNFIHQYDDETDRRSKKLQITESGRREVLSVLPKMNLVSKIVVGNLSVEEQNTLTYLMRKLDHFHNDIYLNDKDQELEVIINKKNTPE